MTDSWTRCSSCKDSIAFDATHFVCSVSTCNRKRTGMVFCSVSCWEAHLPMMRHREAAAVEARAPTRAEWEAQRARDEADAAATTSRRVVAASPAPARAERSDDADDEIPRDVLVVVSKLKKYIRARSGMNTSDSVTEALSDHLRRLCDEAIRNAGADGRRTVLDRDIPPV
jgi:histone H3/H4